MATPDLIVAESDIPYATSRAAAAAGVWRRLSANRLVLLGTVITVVIVSLGILAPWISPHDYAKQDLLSSLEPPLSSGHLLGTDQLGRDTLSRTLQGVRISIFVGFVITAISLVFGGLMGLAAGYYRGKVDTAISAVIDVFWGFPLILIAVLLVGAIGPGLLALMLAVGLINWAGFARVMRGEVLALREREFVEAARALGIRDLRIMWRHILPHAVPATLVLGSYYIALAIIFEAGFSFIGMGVQPPDPSLGAMIGEGR
ncbi:MAG: peptide/nickel transport system permease protein, partial [Gaiellaceae bacterium]|nr:peptide/nickel transport system permease protein [Gaiellaceae bacterium]